MSLFTRSQVEILLRRAGVPFIGTPTYEYTFRGDMYGYTDEHGVFHEMSRVREMRETIFQLEAAAEFLAAQLIAASAEVHRLARIIDGEHPTEPQTKEPKQ